MWRIGEVARRAGVAVSTLHYYEEQGLIESSRNVGNQRQYASSVLRRIGVIKSAQRLGISLKSIKQAFANLPNQRTPTTADWKKLSKQWRAELEQKIQQLTALRDQLDGCIGCGCLSLKKCKLRNPNDELGEKGSGAVLLEVPNLGNESD